MATKIRMRVDAKLESLSELCEVQRELSPPGEARAVIVEEALVSDEMLRLHLPISMIRRLGLRREKTVKVLRGGGLVEVGAFEPVRLTIQGRSVSTDVIEAPEGAPVLIGRLPLMGLDLVIDPEGRRLIGNPRHGGVEMFDL